MYAPTEYLITVKTSRYDLLPWFCDQIKNNNLETKLITEKWPRTAN